MNVFSTDHPLNSQPSWFDADAFPLRSWLCRAFVLALMATPLLLGFVIYCDMSEAFEIGSETDPIPRSWGDWAWGTGGAFVFCLIAALLLVATFRGLAWQFRRTHN